MDTWNARNCPDVEWLAAYLDRRLDDGMTARVEDHLSVCAGCRHEIIDLQRIKKDVDALTASPSAAWFEEARARRPVPRRLRTWSSWLAAAGLLIAPLLMWVSRQATPPSGKQQAARRPPVPSDVLTSRTESFRGDVLDPRFWVQNDPHRMISMRDGLIFKSGEDEGYASLRSRFKLKGDLDVQMDFDLKDWPVPTDTQSVKLGIAQVGSDPPGEFSISRIRNPRADQFWSAWREDLVPLAEAPPAYVSWGKAGPVRTTRGQLRITRTGKTLKGYTREEGGEWVELFSRTTDFDGAVWIRIDVKIVETATVITVPRVSVVLGTFVTK